MDWLNFQKNERLLRLKSANGTASTIVAKRNRGYIKEWEKEYAWLAYHDEKNAMTMFCSSTSSQVRVVGVGKIPPVRLESVEIMRSRPMKAGLVKSLAD